MDSAKMWSPSTPHHSKLFFPQPKAAMATTSNSNAILKVPADIPKFHAVNKNRNRAKIDCFVHKKNEEIQDCHITFQPTRRLAIGLTSVAIFGNSCIESSLAEDNGFWLDGPLPLPYANNKIYNEETGTRSFLKNGVYIADIGTKGRMHRLKRYAFDLIALGDLIAQRDAWNHVRRYLRLKSTFMYFDFDKVISAATIDDKGSLMDLANRLFDSFEKLEFAVRKQDFRQTEMCYKATTTVLEEVMSRMA